MTNYYGLLKTIKKKYEKLKGWKVDSQMCTWMDRKVDSMIDKLFDRYLPFSQEE